jgi:hypothetical protein
MSKTIVTHQNPDLDAIMSVWLLVRFDQGEYGDAAIELVPSGSTYKNLPVDLDPDVVHVDTGLGRFDHHQDGAYGTCASRLVWEQLIRDNKVSPSDTALKEMVAFANEIDTFADCYYPEAVEPRFAFMLSEVIPAMHRLQIHDNQAVIRLVFVYLDSVYQRLKDRVEAMKEIEVGQKFECKWGKAVVVITGADDVNKYAQKLGYGLVIVRDPKKMRTAIKTSPKNEYPLRPLYDKIIELDEPSRWFYHNSDHMVINGTSKAEAEPTSLSLEQIIELVKSIK